MRLINKWGNAIRDAGNDMAKAEYLKSLGYTELVEKTAKPRTPKSTDQGK